MQKNSIDFSWGPKSLLTFIISFFFSFFSPNSFAQVENIANGKFLLAQPYEEAAYGELFPQAKETLLKRQIEKRAQAHCRANDMAGLDTSLPSYQLVPFVGGPLVDVKEGKTKVVLQPRANKIIYMSFGPNGKFQYSLSPDEYKKFRRRGERVGWQYSKHFISAYRFSVLNCQVNPTRREAVMAPQVSGAPCPGRTSPFMGQWLAQQAALVVAARPGPARANSAPPQREKRVQAVQAVQEVQPVPTTPVYQYEGFNILDNHQHSTNQMLYSGTNLNPQFAEELKRRGIKHVFLEGALRDGEVNGVKFYRAEQYDELSSFQKTIGGVFATLASAFTQGPNSAASTLGQVKAIMSSSYGAANIPQVPRGSLEDPQVLKEAMNEIFRFSIGKVLGIRQGLSAEKQEEMDRMVQVYFGHFQFLMDKFYYKNQTNAPEEKRREMNRALDQALLYSIDQRNAQMARRVSEVMGQQPGEKFVLVAGGFHGTALKDHLNSPSKKIRDRDPVEILEALPGGRSAPQNFYRELLKDDLPANPPPAPVSPGTPVTSTTPGRPEANLNLGELRIEGKVVSSEIFPGSELLRGSKKNLERPLKKLISECFPNVGTNLDRFSLGHMESGNVVVMKAGDRVLGLLSCTQQPNQKILIRDVCIGNEHRGKPEYKLGTRLMSSALEKCQQAYGTTNGFELDVLTDNETAKKLYEKFQFQYSPEGERQIGGNKFFRMVRPK